MFRVITIALLLVVVGCSSDDDTSGDDLEYGAFDVCTDFVRDQLVSPGSASFRNYFENDGEVIVTVNGPTYTVRSSVDSENAFGASLRSDFVCVVDHVEGLRYRLVDLSID